MSDRIKTTRGQREQLRKCRVGAGFIVWKSADNETTEVEFYIDGDGQLRRIKDGSLLLPLEVRNEIDCVS